MKKRDLRKRHERRERRRVAGALPNPTPAVPLGQHADWQQAVRSHRAGQLQAARDAYCRVLKQHPRCGPAWHMLGMLMHQGQDHAAALDCLQQALAAGEAGADLLSNLGLVYRALGQLDAACECLERAVAAQADSADTWNNLGTVQLEQHRYDKAEESFRCALEIQPTHRNALTNLGTTLQHQLRYHEAVDYHRQALDLCPQDIRALNNLGCTLRAQRDYEAAVVAFREAARLNPAATEARINLGRTLESVGRLDEAIDCLRLLLGDQPDVAAAHHHLGHALEAAERHEEAYEHFQRAVALDPEYAHALSSLGSAELRRGRQDEAIRRFRQALALRPEMHETYSNLLFILSSSDTLSPAELFAEHRRWGLQYGQVDAVFDDWQGSRDPLRKLRVAYVSPDFREHAVAQFIEPVLRHHDRQQFEVFCYAHVYQPDQVTQRLQSLSDHWRSTCGHSYRQVAEMIRADGIDVLVDLAGHTAGNQLLAMAYRPAPVQISWLGYPNTTGLPAIDYRITSEVQDPEGDESYHTEQLLRLPCGTNCFAAPEAAPDVVAPPCLQNGFLTFGSLHRPQKISSSVYDLWAAIMRENATARLLLFNTAFDRESTDQATRQLVDRRIERERFEIRHATDAPHYLYTYGEIDIGLDVFPWNGGTTTREALWMGVAVVGLRGQRRSARGTAATLHYAGLRDLIADSPHEYVRLATQLATDPARLTRLRGQLRDQLRQTICNAPRFTRHLEETYRSVWRCRLEE